MGYFEANAKYPNAQEYYYVEFPEHFVWHVKNRAWAPCKRFVSTIGRIHFASPAAGERFYLWTLLTVVKGATSLRPSGLMRTFNTHIQGQHAWLGVF